MIVEAIRQAEERSKAAHLDIVAANARASAEGKPFDADAVAAALGALNHDIEFFEKTVATYRDRAEWLASMERAGPTRNRMAKATAALQAEQEKFIAARDAFAERGGKLETEIEQHRETLRVADYARDRLLDPNNVPGGLGLRFAAAKTAARNTGIAAGDAEQALREAEGRIEHFAGWVRELAKEEPENVDPSKWKAKSTQAEWQRDGHDGELERYLKQWRAAIRTRDQIRDDLAEKSKAYANATKTLEALTKEVLQA